jgi:hypothetical protein
MSNNTSHIIKSFLFLVILFTFCSITQGQVNEKEKITFGIEAPTYMSYSGINLGIQANASYKKHTLALGIKTTFQSSYFPYQNSLGMMIDYRYYIVSSEKVKAFISAHYSNVRYKSLGRNTSETNTIHEYTFNNGYMIKLFNKCWIGNSFGVGGYTEQFFDYSEQKKGTYVGYNFMAKTMLIYEF